jgi:hypothetical protein
MADQLPPLQALCISSVAGGAATVLQNSTDTGTKRGAPASASQQSGKRAAGRKLDAWQTHVLRDTWSGVPGGMGKGMSQATKDLYGSEAAAKTAAYSPKGEWGNREKKRDVVLDTTLPAGCEVNDNVFGFEPQGKHHLPPHMVRSGLLAHYDPAKVDDLMKDIPPPDATASHLRRWVRTLDVPVWAQDARTAAPQGPAMSTPQVKIGSDTWFGPIDCLGRPDGVGTMFFKETAESYRGQYDKGVMRRNSMGVRIRLNEASEGMYDDNGLWLTAQVVANRELAKEAARASAIGGGFSYIDRMLVEKPGMGRITAGQGQIVLRRASSDVHEATSRFFKASNPAQLNKGADSVSYTGWGTGYTEIKPIATFDVDYSRSQIQRDWERVQASYKTNSSNCPMDDKLFVRTQKAFVEDEGTDITSQGVPLDENTGEKYLVHGSSALAIESILNTNFDIGRSRAGWYGRAVYFADDPSKSDQYARSDRGARVYGLLNRLGIKDEEWKSLAVKSITGHQEVFFMFVTRVALGCTAELTKDVFDQNKTPEGAPIIGEKLFYDAQQPPVDNPPSHPRPGNEMRYVQKLNKKFNSVCVSAFSQGNTSMRFREVTVYDSVVAKITHLVAYVRAEKKTEVEKQLMGKAWEAKGDPFRK